MAFKRSAVRSRLSPPQNTDFSMKSRCFSNFLTCFQFKISFGSTKSVNILLFAVERTVKMAYIQEKIKGKKIVSFKFKACVGREADGKQVFKCMTWYPPDELTPAKARKEADRVAARWEDEVRLAYSQQTTEDKAPPAPVYTFDTFVNEVWLPLCVRDGSHRPSTIAMYTNILKVILMLK